MGAWTPPPPPDAAAAEPAELVTRSLAGRKARPVRWLVDGKVPLGKVTMLAGVGGMGKSTLTRHLVARLTTGRPAFGLDYDPPPACEVLIASVEDSPEDTIVPHLVAEGADLARVHMVEGVRRGQSDRLVPFDLRDLELMEATLGANPRIALLVIDPVMSFVGRAGVNENASAEVRALLDPLLELAARYGIAVVLIAHLNKSTAVAAVNRIVGSTAFRDGARAVYAVGTDPQDADRRVMALVKENVPGLDRRSVAFSRVAVAGDDLGRVLAAPEFADLDPPDRERMGAQLAVLAGFRSVHLDADSALGTGRREAEGAGSGDCAAWLQERLGDAYAWPDAEVERDAVAQGYTVRQYRRAKEKLRPALCSAPPAWGQPWLIAMGPVKDKTIRPAELGGQTGQTGQTQSFSGKNGPPQSAHPPGGGQTEDDPILADLRREP